MFNLNDRVRTLASYDDNFVEIPGVVDDITPVYDEIYNEDLNEYDDGDLVGYDYHVRFDEPVRDHWGSMETGAWFPDDSLELLEKPPRKKSGFALFLNEKGL